MVNSRSAGLLLMLALICGSASATSAAQDTSTCPPKQLDRGPKCNDAKPAVQPTASRSPTITATTHHTYVYCSPSPSAPLPSASVPPTASKSPDECKKNTAGTITEVDLKLKNAGLTIKSSNTTIGYIAAAVALALVVAVVWFGLMVTKIEPGGDNAPALTVIALLVCLAMLGGAIAGYWLKGDAVSLSQEEVRSLAKSPDLLRALENVGSLNEDRSRLQARVTELERDLTVARVHADRSLSAGSSLVLGIASAALVAALLGAVFLAWRTTRARANAVELETLLSSLRQILDSPPLRFEHVPFSVDWAKGTIESALRVIDHFYARRRL
jgi:hypothetical protein